MKNQHVKKFFVFMFAFLLAFSLFGCKEEHAYCAGVKEVLYGEGDFVLKTDEGETDLDINTVIGAFVPEGTQAKRDRFRIVHPQEGENPIVILRIDCPAGDMGGYVVLGSVDGKVLGYKFDRRAFDRLREDGSFVTSNAAGSFEKISALQSVGEDGVAIKDLAKAQGEGFRWTEFEVNGQRARKEDYLAALKAQEDKPPVAWLELTDENIRLLSE